MEWGAEPVDGPLHGLPFAIKDNIDLIGYPTTADVDALLLPVTPGHPTLAEVAADPIRVNARLGTFTNFANLLDLWRWRCRPGSATTACRSGCN